MTYPRRRKVLFVGGPMHGKVAYIMEPLHPRRVGYVLRRIVVGGTEWITYDYCGEVKSD